MSEILHAFGVNWKLLGIQLLNFGVLLYLLRRFLYTPLFAMMEEREKKVKQGIKDAELVAKEKDAIETSKFSILSDARKEGDGIVMEIRKRATEEGRTILSAAEDRARRIVHEGEMIGERRKEEIVNASKDELARYAVKAIEKHLRGQNA